MKRLFIVLIALILSVSAYAEVTWFSRSEVKSFRQTVGEDVNITSIASCDTQNEVEELCDIDNLDRFYVRTSYAQAEGLNFYAVVYTVNSRNITTVFIYHYLPSGYVEMFMVFY